MRLTLSASRPGGRGLPLLLMDALGELLDRLGAERVEIVGVAARDQPGVDVDLLVHPVRTGVLEIRPEAWERGQRPPFDDAGLDQQPRRVTDRRDPKVSALSRWLKASLTPIRLPSRQREKHRPRRGLPAGSAYLFCSWWTG